MAVEIDVEGISVTYLPASGDILGGTETYEKGD